MPSYFLGKVKNNWSRLPIIKPVSCEDFGCTSTCRGVRMCEMLLISQIRSLAHTHFHTQSHTHFRTRTCARTLSNSLLQLCHTKKKKNVISKDIMSPIWNGLTILWWFLYVFAIRVVEFSSGAYKIRNIFA